MLMYHSRCRQNTPIKIMFFMPRGGKPGDELLLDIINVPALVRYIIALIIFNVWFGLYGYRYFPCDPAPQSAGLEDPNLCNRPLCRSQNSCEFIEPPEMMAESEDYEERGILFGWLNHEQRKRFMRMAIAAAVFGSFCSIVPYLLARLTEITLRYPDEELGLIHRPEEVSFLLAVCNRFPLLDLAVFLGPVVYIWKLAMDMCRERRISLGEGSIGEGSIGEEKGKG